MSDSTKNIFLIDDDENINFYNEDLISEFEEVEDVKVQEDSQAALEFIESAAVCKNIPKIWFVDINMPRLNGFEFVDKAIKKIKTLNCKPDISIYMLSSSSYQTDVEEANKRSYIKGFLTKPLLESHLISILKDQA
jgi:CheY-like chemotaxis protein